MNGTGTDDRTDEALRALLAQADPEQNTPRDTNDHLLARVRAQITSPPQSEGLGSDERGSEDSANDGPTSAHSTPSEPESSRRRPATAAGRHPSWLHRHWQGSLLVAAGVAALALAAPSVLPGLDGGGGQDSAASIASSELAPSGPEAAIGSSDTSIATRDVDPPTLVRSASVLVGTEDIEAERETFVATILALGGRVTSETVVAQGASGNLGASAGILEGQDLAMPSPGFPWYPTGPGVWLSVEVPVANYDRALAAARGAGEVVRSEQSSYDVGAQIADVDARIAALEASVARLTDLMSQADGVSDVIKLEQAIATRQAELDALSARQRELANQTEMSRLSLTLMSPEDARSAVDPDPEPQRTWWESLLAGLSQFWQWLGRALLIVSPLLIAAAIIWWVRRRQAGSSQPVESPGADGPRQPTRSEPADPDTA